MGGFESSCHVNEAGVRLDMLHATQHDRFVAEDYAALRKLRIATFNVNGIRSRLPHLLQWLAKEQPDIACLQELKAVDEGFPIGEIADRIVEAAEGAPVLAARVPALAQATRSGLVKQAVIRSALIGFVGARLGRSRPLLALEQARLLSRLRAVSSGPAVAEELPVMAGSAAAVLASGFALRTAARTAGAVLPTRLVNAGVAAAGTWALARAFRVLEPRLPSS